MPTQCSAEQFGFGTAERRAVVAAFYSERGTSDAGALLFWPTDRALHLVKRFAACFQYHRSAYHL